MESFLQEGSNPWFRPPLKNFMDNSMSKFLIKIEQEKTFKILDFPNWVMVNENACFWFLNFRHKPS